MLFAIAAYGAVIIVISSPYGGITDTPCFVEAHGDGTKKIAYTSSIVNPDTTWTHFLTLQETDGSDLNGWPYQFPAGEFCSGGIAIYDIDSDKKEEVIIKGGDINGYFCRIFKHTDDGPIILHDLPVNITNLPLSKAPYEFWSSKIVVGDIDDDMEPEIIVYQNAIDLNGRQKSIVEGLGSGRTIFVLGTPMLIRDEKTPLIVFHAVEIPRLSNLKNFTHALYCIRLNWDMPNDLLWRVQIGKGERFDYKSNWGELGAADLDNDGHPEIVATAGIDNYKFEFRVIKTDGRVVNSARLGFDCGIYGHTRFVIADIGGPAPSVIFFPSSNSGDYYNLPQSQPACSSIDEDGEVDFFIRGRIGKKSVGPWWENKNCFFKLSPRLTAPTNSPYEPIICPLNADNIDEIFITSAHKQSYDAAYLSHLALGDSDNGGYFTLVGVTPDGSGLDILSFDTLASNRSDWRQAYGNSCRTNNFVLEETISVEINETDWNFTIGLGKGLANADEYLAPMHIIKNRGNTNVDLEIGYAAVSACKPGYEPGLDTFAVVYGYEHGQAVSPDGRMVIEKNIAPAEERGLPLVYCAPTGVTIGIEDMKAVLELRAYKAAE